MPRKATGGARLRGSTWFARIRLRDGSRKDVTLQGGVTTKAQATATARKLQHEYDAGRWDPMPTAKHVESAIAASTVLDVARAWARVQAHSSADEEIATIDRYVQHSELARMPVVDVRPRHVLEFLRWLATLPSRKGGTLAERTRRSVYSVVHRVLAHAVLCEHIAANPCDALPRSAIPRVVDKHPSARSTWLYTRDELAVLTSSRDVPVRMRVTMALLAYTGLRVGELAALRWGDWADRQPLSALMVSRSMERQRHDEKATKTTVAREVPVHPALQRALASWRRDGWERAYGRTPTASDRIVPLESGEDNTQHAVYSAVQSTLQRLGMRPRRVHDLRRTFVTAAREGGARPDVLKHVTHTPASVIDLYTTMPWSTLCDAVLCVPTFGDNNGDNVVNLRVNVARPTRLESVADDADRAVPREPMRSTVRIATDADAFRDASGTTRPRISEALRHAEAATFATLERWELAHANERSN